MTYITKMNYERRHQRMVIRQYLEQKRLSPELGGTIMRHVIATGSKQKKSLRESDIALFQALPRNLLEKMRTEVYLPTLEWHSLFNFVHHHDPTLFKGICQQAMSERCLAMAEELFRFGAK